MDMDILLFPFQLLGAILVGIGWVAAWAMIFGGPVYGLILICRWLAEGERGRKRDRLRKSGGTFRYEED
jgi:hypothetical protein